MKPLPDFLIPADRGLRVIVGGSWFNAAEIATALDTVHAHARIALLLVVRYELAEKWTAEGVDVKAFEVDKRIRNRSDAERDRHLRMLRHAPDLCVQFNDGPVGKYDLMLLAKAAAVPIWEPERTAEGAFLGWGSHALGHIRQRGNTCGRARRSRCRRMAS